MKICIGSIMKCLTIGLLGAALLMNFLAIRHMRAVMRMLATVISERASAAPSAAEKIEEVEDSSNEQSPDDDDSADCNKHDQHPDSEEGAIFEESSSATPLAKIEEVPEEHVIDVVTEAAPAADVSPPQASVESKKKEQPAAPKAKAAQPNSRHKKRKRSAPVTLPSNESTIVFEPDVVKVEEEVVQSQQQIDPDIHQTTENGTDAPSIEQPNAESN